MVMKLIGVFIINMDCRSERMNVLDKRHIVPINKAKTSKKQQNVLYKQKTFLYNEGDRR